MIDRGTREVGMNIPLGLLELEIRPARLEIRIGRMMILLCEPWLKSERNEEM
jgi:hypothetical protein